MSNTISDTRNSLLLRLPDRADIDAWDQFVDVYQPLIFRLARSKGFQEADANDIVQEVLLAVSKSIHRWDHEPNKGRFRDWLYKIARNLMINFLTRRKHLPLGQGGTDLVRLLNDQVDPNHEDSAASREFDIEYRRQLYMIAARHVRHDVRVTTWQAFQRTSIEGLSIAEAAQVLAMSEGTVVVARCRVLARLRDTVKRLEGESPNEK
ncbi:MAG: sigma-70 family RNA polymerase sigma factor [Pirellulaceae bacterium]|nr:sigma-70 family RNA polymerase sigma factor [Pirellulaceae bacterium]